MFEQNGSPIVCEWCGRRIPLRRLRMLPRATSCVGCQSQIERERAGDDERSECDASHSS